MEIKAVTEYEEPKYLTKEESRNKILRCFMGIKNVSISVCAVLLLNNIAFAAGRFNPPDIQPIEACGGAISYPSIADIIVIFSILAKLCSLGITFILFISGIVCLKKSRKIENEEEKEKIRKRGKLCFIVGIALPVYFMIVEFTARLLRGDYIEFSSLH